MCVCVWGGNGCGALGYCTAEKQLCQFWVVFSKSKWARRHFFFNKRPTVLDQITFQPRSLFWLSVRSILWRELSVTNVKWKIHSEWALSRQAVLNTAAVTGDLWTVCGSPLPLHLLYSDGLAYFESCLVLVQLPKLVIGGNEGYISRETLILTHSLLCSSGIT